MWTALWTVLWTVLWTAMWTRLDTAVDTDAGRLDTPAQEERCRIRLVSSVTWL